MSTNWAGLTQKQWKTQLQDMIAKSDKALYRAILCINDGQTASEKASGETIEENGVGFNKYDANIMSSFAEQLHNSGSLSFKQKAYARKVMPKYWRQLMVISKQNLGIA